MLDDLRTRIAAVMYRHTLFRALEQCECGAAFDGFSGRSLDAYAAHVADAVIAELRLRQEESWGTTFPDVPVEDRRLTRWVTEWTADE